MSEHIDSSRSLLHSRVVAAVAACGFAASLSMVGCDRRSPAAKGVDDASRTLTMMSGGQGPAATDGIEKQDLADAIKSAQSGGADGLAEEVSAATLIAAQAQLAQAAHPANDAAAAERDAASRGLLIRSLAVEWVKFNAIAAVDESVDSTKHASELTSQIEARVKEAAKESERRQAVEARIASLLEKSGGLNRQIAAADEEIVRLRTEATRGTAVQAEPLIRQAAERRRASDQLRIEAGLLEAQAEQAARESAEIQLLIEKAQNQEQSLQRSRTQVVEREKAAKRDAAQSRAEAAKIAVAIDAAASDLATLRSGDVAQKNAAAISAYQAAAATARKAGSDSSGMSKLVAGNAQQSLGEHLLAQVRGFESEAILLESLASIDPALPHKQKYADGARTARESASQALASAKEAFEAAQSSFSGVRQKGDAKERLERLSVLIGKMAEKAGGANIDMLAELARKPVVEGDETPAADTSAPSGDVAGQDPALTAAIEIVLNAAKTGDSGPVMGILYASEADQPVLDALRSLMGGQAKLDASTKAKFGQSFTEWATSAEGKAAMGPVGGMLGNMGSMGGSGPISAEQLEAVKSLNASDLKPVIDGDRATIDFGPQQVVFMRVGSEWKLDAGLGAAPDQLKTQLKTVLGPVGDIMASVATDVDTGIIQSNQAAMARMMQRLMPLMQQLQGGGGGGG